jgi:hypothetical protein
MEPEDEKTLTIARRTRKNLEYIYRKKSDGEDVEEFTQLLNSMLGMVISLREDYFKGRHIGWERVEELKLLQGWYNLKSITGKTATQASPNLQKINSFSQLITKLRNAFAHNCFELISDRESKQITGITVWNIPSGQDNKPQNRVWEANISELNLKGLAYLVVAYIEQELGP